MARHFLVVVTGLLAEARLANPASGWAIAGGADAARLETQIDRALSEGAGAVLSFGLAAGLEPGRAPGALVVPQEIIGASGRYATDARWSERIRSALHDCDPSPLIGVDSPLIRPADKVQLHSTTGAIAADMESHIVARLAVRAGRPFAVLRVIADPAERALPAAAVIGMKPGGGVNVAGVLASLLRNPRQLPDLARVATDVRTAMQVLSLCRVALGPDLGWVPDASPAA
jgi:adenosylhomocysteine nucleosidase